MNTRWELLLLIFIVYLSNGDAFGHDLERPLPFDSAHMSDTPLPLISSSKVKRLPPVSENFSPTQWVADPAAPRIKLWEPIMEPTSAAWPQPVSPEVISTPWPMLMPKPPKTKLWEGSFSFGLDGAEGNNEAMNLRVGFDAQRKTNYNILLLNLDYNRRTTDSTSTANRLYSLARYERIIQQTQWSLFIGATGEYDEFQPWDFRVTSHGGLGHWLLKTSTSSLKGRFGAGFSHEINNPEGEYYAPEMVVGLDYERKISKRQRLVASVDYMPDLSDFTEFRLNSQAGWEVTLDKETNLSLRLAARNRYNSSPGTALPNDLDYAALLLWKL